MRALLIFLTIICLSASSCRKDPPTTKPLIPWSYFPVYPGSWWKYADSSGNVTTYSTSPHYVLYDATLDIWPGQYAKVGPYLLTYYEGSPILGNKRPDNKYTNDGMTTFLDTLQPVGFRLYNGEHWGWQWFTEVIAKDTSMIVQGKRYDHIIGMRENSSNGGWFIPSYRTYYYARNIGIVKIIAGQKNNPKDSVYITTSTDLVDYFVNASH
jgi:hypothetical protein